MTRAASTAAQRTPMVTDPLLILVVEDSCDVATMVQFALLRAGMLPTVVHTGAAACARLVAARYAILLTDWSLPDMTAATLIAATAALPQPPAIILMSGHRPDALQEAGADPIITYLEKPFPWRHCMPPWLPGNAQGKRGLTGAASSQDQVSSLARSMHGRIARSDRPPSFILALHRSFPMIEDLPAARLCGMADPAAWLVQVAQRLTRRVPTTPPCWHHGPPDQGILTWHTTTGAGEPMSLWLWITPPAVSIRVWHAAWQGVERIGEDTYWAFLTTIATTLIDQDTDPDGPPIQLQVQATQPYPQH